MDVRADADGHLWEASFSLRLAGRHVYGTGERYTCPDQAGREILFSTHERFTFQGQRSYLPVPLFYTEQGVGVLHQCSCEFFARFWSLDGGQTNVALCYQCEPGPTAFQDIFLFGCPHCDPSPISGPDWPSYYTTGMVFWTVDVLQSVGMRGSGGGATGTDGTTSDPCHRPSPGTLER